MISSWRPLPPVTRAVNAAPRALTVSPMIARCHQIRPERARLQPHVGAVGALRLHVGVAPLHRALDAALRELLREDDGARLADRGVERAVPLPASWESLDPTAANL